VEVPTLCSPSLVGWPVCAGPLCAWSPATAFHGVWDSTGPAHLDRHRSAQLRSQWTTNMEQSASWTQNTRCDFVLLQASSQGPPFAAVVCAAAGRWTQHRSSGAVVTVQRVWRRLHIFRHTYLLTYLLTYFVYTTQGYLALQTDAIFSDFSTAGVSVTQLIMFTPSFTDVILILLLYKKLS